MSYYVHITHSYLEVKGIVMELQTRRLQFCRPKFKTISTFVSVKPLDIFTRDHDIRMYQKFAGILTANILCGPLAWLEPYTQTSLSSLTMSVSIIK